MGGEVGLAPKLAAGRAGMPAQARRSGSVADASANPDALAQSLNHGPQSTALLRMQEHPPRRPARAGAAGASARAERSSCNRAVGAAGGAARRGGPVRQRRPPDVKAKADLTSAAALQRRHSDAMASPWRDTAPTGMAAGHSAGSSSPIQPVWEQDREPDPEWFYIDRGDGYYSNVERGLRFYPDTNVLEELEDPDEPYETALDRSKPPHCRTVSIAATGPAVGSIPMTACSTTRRLTR